MEKLKVNSPAKINIGLNIIRKRSDGFHDLETIFYPLNLYDIIVFEKSDNLYFNSNNEQLNQEDSNLIIKAIKILEEKSGKKLNVKIELEKNIPIGAGLGGGSSNAAFTLSAINNFFDLNFTSDELSKLALELGSDVPYFLNPVPSFAESRGEILFPISLNINFPIVIVNPGIHISTKWAFENLITHKPKFRLRDLGNIKSKDDFEELRFKIFNDFEEVVFNKYPEIKAIKNKFYESGALFSLMTGTGSSVFGIFNNLKEAEEFCSNLKKEYFRFISYK